MLRKVYWTIGGAVCLWYAIAAFANWKAPNFGIVDAMNAGSSGRGSSGYYGGWGGGK